MTSATTTTEIKRLSDCSFSEAVKIWNEGFQGYFVDMTTSLEGYLARLQRDGVSPELSLMAFCEGRRSGFLLNSLSAGRRVVWNAGTGVSPEFRGRGVGKALMTATLDLYHEHGVEIAMLEAVSENQHAISLYEKFGYEIIDGLLFLRHTGKLGERAFSRTNAHSYSAELVSPYAVGKLEFYEEMAPWQTHWDSVRRNNGNALIVSDAKGAAVGYALYMKKYDKRGKVVDIALCQCVARPDSETEAVVASALQSVYAPFEWECERSTFNFSKSNAVARRMLVEAGFTSFIEQVHMIRRFNTFGVDFVQLLSEAG
ncbi:MAG: GNAT family N-acetyltransferase [Acidobacteriota bacterium]|nr:GNAT family N-acetyltransferase [Acidobacteriota bacterium]